MRFEPLTYLLVYYRTCPIGLKNRDEVRTLDPPTDIFRTYPTMGYRTEIRFEPPRPTYLIYFRTYPTMGYRTGMRFEPSILTSATMEDFQLIVCFSVYQRYTLSKVIGFKRFFSSRKQMCIRFKFRKRERGGGKVIFLRQF